jgi:hypothetical protein
MDSKALRKQFESEWEGFPSQEFLDKYGDLTVEEFLTRLTQAQVNQIKLFVFSSN